MTSVYSTDPMNPTLHDDGEPASRAGRDRTLLAKVLTANGAFSLGSGAVAVVASRSLGDRMGLGSWWLIAVGLGLCAYGVELLVAARRAAWVVTAARLALIADLAWVVGVGAIAAGGIGGLSTAGRWVLAATCVPVVDLALIQWRLLRRGETATP